MKWCKRNFFLLQVVEMLVLCGQIIPPTALPAGSSASGKTYKGTKLDMAAVHCCALAVVVRDASKWQKRETRSDERQRGVNRRKGWVECVFCTLFSLLMF